MSNINIRNKITTEFEDLYVVQGSQGKQGDQGAQGDCGTHYGAAAPSLGENVWVDSNPIEEEITVEDAVQTYYDYEEPIEVFGDEGDIYLTLEETEPNYAITYSLNNGNQVTSYYSDFDEMKTFISDNNSDLTGYFKLRTIHLENKEISCSYLFNECENLTELDLEEFDGSRNTSMWRFCWSCFNLKTVKASNLDTSNVTNFSSCFSECYALENIDVSNWDVSNATTLGWFFYNNTSLKEINISGWNAEKTTALTYMFSDCSSLQKIDLSNFNTSEVTIMTYMFNGCLILEEIIGIENLNTSSATTLYGMFRDCQALKELKLNNWNVSNVENLGAFVIRCYELETLEVSDWSTGNITSLYYTFASCFKLTELNVLNWDVSKVTTAQGAFQILSSILSFSLKNLNFEKCTDFQGFLAGNLLMETIDISGMKTPVAESFYDIFTNCHKLEEVIGLEELYSPIVTNTRGMFWKGYALKKIDLSSFDTSLVDYSIAMFSDCFSVVEAYGRTQEDCDLFNESDRPDNVYFVVKTAYTSALFQLGITPASTEEEQIEQLIEMGVDYTTL